MRMDPLAWAVIAALSQVAVHSSAQVAQVAQVYADAQEPRFLYAPARSEAALVQVDATKVPVLRQRIAVNVAGLSTEAALNQIANRAGLRLTYPNGVVPSSARAHLQANDITVAGALTEVLRDTGIDVVLSANDQVVLVKRPTPPPEGIVTGTIVDAKTSEAVRGATVALEGTHRSTFTGDSGQYRIANVPAGTYTVSARRIGYAPQAQSLTVNPDQDNTLDFKLEQAPSKLDEVIVAGSFVESSRREAPVPVTVLSEDEIHRPSRNRIDQLFRGEVPGVVGYDNGASALGLVVYVRGSASLDDSNLLKVYVDGIEAPADFLVSGIDLSSIERVELLRGPQASTIYGSNASGGVLLLFTKNGHPGKPHLSGSAAAGITQSDFVNGTPATTEDRLNLSGGGDGFTYSFGGSFDGFGAVVPQGNWRQMGGYGRTVITQGPLSVALTADLSHRVLGASNFPAFETLGVPSLAALRNDDFILSNQLFGATFTYASSPRWQHVLTLGYNAINLDENNYAPQRSSPDDTLRNASLQTDNQITARFVSSLTANLAPHITSSSTAGIDVSRRNFNYYQGNGLADPATGNSAQSDFIQAYLATNNAGFFGQEVLGFSNRLFFTGGLRAEHNSNVGSGEGLIWAPRAGVAYTMNSGSGFEIKPRVSYGKSIRPPQPGQSGSSESFGIIQVANPDLRPEVQTGVDAGVDLDFHHGVLTFEGTYFDQNADDLIGTVYLSSVTDPTVVTQYQNVGRVNNKGIELGVSANVGQFGVRGTFSTVRSRIKSLATGYTGDQQPGDEMLYVARRSGGAAVNYRFIPFIAAASGRQGNIELGLTYVGSRRSLDLLSYYQCAYLGENCQGTLRDFQVDLDPFTKFRLSVSQPISHGADLFLNVENLTNKQIGEFEAIAPSRGRTVLLGIRFGQ
jgi:outer membrane receptor protein involved in Fe transport